MLCPAGQELGADVHPSFTEVMFIKKVQKSLDGLASSQRLECTDLDQLSKGAGYVPTPHVPYLKWAALYSPKV